ncbi:MAG: DegT/DnrJ/EryC1/StrS family aminotransferase [Vicinamibacterales bacterium]
MNLTSRTWAVDAPVREHYLVFGSPQLLEPEIDGVVAAMRSAWIGTGPRVQEFETAFARYIGTPYPLAVNSCTAALHLALVALGVGPGDEVIVPAMTFASTANVVIHAGGVPVFADVDRSTMCLDPVAAEQKITARTKVILPVHFAGRACDIDALMAVASSHGLHLLEDCAHAIETLWHGRHAGTFGAFGAFSFYATKNVVTGEGGLLATANEAWAERVQRLALHGLSAHAWKRFSDAGFKHYEVMEPGFKYNMMDLQAAIGLPQLERVEANLGRREEIWARYDRAFIDLPAVVPAPVAEDTRHARHLYTLLLDIDHLTATRDEVQGALHAQGIGTGLHYKALHQHHYYRERFGARTGSLVNAEWISERTISLPLGPRLSEGDVDDVIFAVRQTLLHFAR